MATERDFELLDDYLSNRMGSGEKASFERKLEADPDLRNEYNLQQHLVKGLANARKAELKTLLNNTPIPASYSGGSISAGAKFAIGSFVAVVIATGIYLYADQNEPQPPVLQEQNAESTPKADEEVVVETESEQPADEVTDKSGDASTEAKPENQEQEQTSTKKPDVKQAPVKQLVLDVFDPTKESAETVSPGDESPRTSDSKPGSSMVVEVLKHHKNFAFHYQVKDGKLFLYGPFEENLYEIMEFFSEAKRTTFLFHKDNYYLIEEDSDKIRPLKPIEDQTLISKLKEYRGN